MRCAIYTRVSTDEQAMSEYNSLRRQEEVCRHYISIHAEKGWRAAGVYEDAGYSGKDVRRPGIQELLEDVQAGRAAMTSTYFPLWYRGSDGSSFASAAAAGSGGSIFSGSAMPDLGGMMSALGTIGNSPSSSGSGGGGGFSGGGSGGGGGGAGGGF